MKTRLISLFFILFALMPMYTFGQDASEIKQILKDVVKEINAQCPEEVEENMYLMEVTLTNDNMVMVMKYNDPDIDFSEWTSEEISSFKSVLKDQLSDDENFALLKEICKMGGYGVQVKLKDKEDNPITVLL